MSFFCEKFYLMAICFGTFLHTNMNHYKTFIHGIKEQIHHMVHKEYDTGILEVAADNRLSPAHNYFAVSYIM